jgi:molybdopterin-guanine dinucleotide biosynthesis protein MobB
MVKVIPVAGLSGSGKTTFIRALIPLLAKSGPVGAVKHIGHHAMQLPEGKDTTVMLGAGAGTVAGIDLEKTIIILKSTSLADALALLSGQGIAYAVVEGYRTGPLPKIAIGDAEVEGCILRNPSPDEVIRSLDRFPSYYTLGEMRRELEDESRAEGRPADLACAMISLPERMEGKYLSRPGDDLPGVIGMRVVIHRGSLFGKADELLIAVAAETGEAAAAALGRMMEQNRGILGKTPRI